MSLGGVCELQCGESLAWNESKPLGGCLLVVNRTPAAWPRINSPVAACLRNRLRLSDTVAHLWWWPWVRQASCSAMTVRSSDIERPRPSARRNSVASLISCAANQSGSYRNR